AGFALGDLNGDGKNEILITTTQGSLSSLAVLTNQSTASSIAFSSPVLYTVDKSPVGVAVHLNGSGVVDQLVTANSLGNDATLLRPNAAGTLQASTELGLQSAVPSAVAVGDVNNDHLPDLIVANLPSGGFFFTDNVQILLNQGNGTYGSPITVNV